MSNKSTQFAQNTNIAKQNLRNGKTIDYEKNLAEFRNAISYIDAQLKEGKDNPLIIKTCQNLIRTISGLDLPADVKRHELAVAPSGVQKLYQQMGQSKNGNSGSSKLRQEAMHNAIQQSLKDQIANLHNMSKAERMEFYKRLMTAESLQEAINNGFIVNDEYAKALLDKAEADLQRLEYLKNQIAELEEKERNGTITSEERVRLQQCRADLPKAEEDLKNTVETTKVASQHYQGYDPVVQQGLNGCTLWVLNGDTPVHTNERKSDGYEYNLATSLAGIALAEDDFMSNHNNLEFVFDKKLALEAMKNDLSRNAPGVTNKGNASLMPLADRFGPFEKSLDTLPPSVSGNALAGSVLPDSVNASFDKVLVDVSRAGNFNSGMLDVTGNESTGSFLEALTSPKGFTGTNFASTFTENHNVDKVANEKVGENFATSKEFYTKSDIGNTITLSSAQKNEFTEENNIIVGGREDLLAIFDNRTDVNAKEVFNLNTAGYEFNNILQTSSANEPKAGLDEVEKVKNGLVTQEERQKLEQVQLEMVKANQQANENKYISSFIQVNTQPKPVKTDENNADENKPDFQSAMNALPFGIAGKVIKEASNKGDFDLLTNIKKPKTEEHNKPTQNNEADVQAFIQNNASFGLEKAIITTTEKVDEVKSLKQSDFWNQMDKTVLSSYEKVIEEKSGINKVVSNTTAKPNKATEPKKESSLNKTLASNTEQKNDLASNATTQTSDITENKNDIFNQSFAPTTDVTSYDVSTNFTLSDSSGQQGSSLTGALSAASYNPYEQMTPSFGNAR